MQAAQIPLGHLYSTGVQPSHEYSPQEDELINMLVNRDQYLQDQQLEQVGKMMSSVRFPDVLPRLQGKALASIEKHKQDLLNLYKSQKSKKTLSAENLLKAQQLRYGLESELKTYEYLSKDFNDKAGPAAMKWSADGLLNQQEESEELKKFYGYLEDNTRNLTDIPPYSEMLRAKVQPKLQKKQRDMTLDEIAKLEKPIVDKFQGKSYTDAKQQEIESTIDLVYPGDALQWGGEKYLSIGALPPNATRDDIKKVMANRIMAQAWTREKAPGNTTNVNLPAWERNQKPKYRVTEDKELYFTNKPTDGIVVTEAFGKVQPGDLFIPKRTITKNGRRYVLGTTVTKGEFELGDGYVKTSTGAKYNPVEVPLDDNVKDIIESNYFKFDADGNPDRSVWTKLKDTGEDTRPADPLLQGTEKKPKKAIKGW